MSRLKELIQEYCPDGVEYKKVSDVADIVGGKDYKNFGPGDVPVYGSGGIMTYVDTSAYDGPSVLLPRKGSIENVYYVDGPFWNVDTIFYTKIHDEVIPKYFYYVMCNEHIEKLNTSNAARPALTSTVLRNIEIPIPPLPVQQEIVRILDSFSNLEQELEQELEQRKKQYEFYRNYLLHNSNYQSMYLKDVVISISSGKNKDRNNDGIYPVYGSTGIISKTNNVAYDKPQILVARVGANAGYVQIAEGQYDVSDNTLIVDVNERYSLKYIYYLLVNSNLNQYAKGGGQPLITAGDLKKLIIHIPTRKEQDKIVNYLDKFNSICTDLTSGLPAEISLRKKQYEYYRDRLLSFPRKA